MPFTLLLKLDASLKRDPHRCFSVSTELCRVFLATPEHEPLSGQEESRRKTIRGVRKEVLRKRRGCLRCDMLPELRSYLEGVLDDALAHAGMTIRNRQLREQMLCTLLEELDTFIFFRICAALPPSHHILFFALIEQGMSVEAWQALTTHALSDLQAFAQKIFEDFRDTV